MFNKTGKIDDTVFKNLHYILVVADMGGKKVKDIVDMIPGKKTRVCTVINGVEFNSHSYKSVRKGTYRLKN